MTTFLGTTIEATDELPTGGGSGFEPVPEGRYKAIIRDVTVEDKTLSGGDITELTWKLEIVEGEHKGRLLWQAAPTKHYSDKAQRFGHALIGNAASAIGEGKISDAAVFKDCIVGIEVGIQPATERNGKTYKARNKVLSFFAKDGVESNKPTSQKERKAPPPAESTEQKSAPVGAASGPWDDDF